MRLLVAIPVYNEKKYVRQVLEKVRQFHGQVVVIDDGSTDGTTQLLRRLNSDGMVQLVEHGTNRGYGQSIISEFEYADRNGYDWVVTMDCDEQHEPEMIPKFIEQIGLDDADVISGSRYLENRTDNDLPPGDRRAINSTVTSTLNELFNFGITDAFCGFKAHRVSSMISLCLDETGYAFPLQFWPRVARAGLRVRELPVRLIYNDPNRHFGGDLDVAETRLRHYLDVLNRELATQPSAGVEASPCELWCGCRD